MATDVSMPAGVLGVFSDPAAAARAVRAVRSAGATDVRAAMPAAYPEILAALERPRSRIGIPTMAGALAGTLLGFALCIGTSLSWPLVTGGKPIVSIPPFVVIAFELSVLVGALANQIALATGATRGRRLRAVPPGLRFAEDRIAIFVAGGDPEAAERALREGGAEEVQRVG